MAVRLFVAVWPDDATVALLAALERPAVERVRWTGRDQWHVTLQFLGSVEDPAPVADALGALEARARDVTLGPATAWFPGRRVLQVPVEGLDDVAAAAEGLVARFVSAPVGHPGFVGHLTLARVRGRPLPARLSSALAGQPLVSSWRAVEVTLVVSHPNPSGARYEVLARVPLAPGP